MSLKSSLWRYLGLLAVAALAVGVFAGPASAKKMSAKQRAAVRTQLRKQVKKNPAVINRKSFLKRASLVNFKLPITIRLRDASSAANPNSATVDLGASLGQREINLGGKLAAELTFHDSYDGGALGNVDLDILPSTTKSLTSTSIPLLWNSDVSRAGTSWDSTLLKAGGLSDASLTALGHDPGCGDVRNANQNANGNLPFALGVKNSDGSDHYVTNPAFDPAQPVSPTNPPQIPSGDGAGLTGVPIHGGGSPTGPVIGFAPAHIASTNANVDNSIDALQASKALSGVPSVDNNRVGGNPTPFPYSPSSQPTGVTLPPSPADTVLRTNALNLNVATAGTQVNASTNTNNGTNAQNGVSGSQNTVIGKSGGQANLFGKIPGKAYGIDVTVNLATRINSILRIEDQDAFEPLIAGANWPAAVFSCTQVWTGGIQNYIPAVRLQGDLKISPGITADGHLRIAKATIASPPTSQYNARFAVAACLAPFSAYNQEVPGQSTVPTPGPGNVVDANGTLAASALPANSSAVAPAPAANCNAAPSPLVANSALPSATVNSLTPSLPGNAYTTSESGASVSVGADLHVNNVAVDVLIGDV